MGNGFVYLAEDGDIYKIGRTTNLDQRLDELRRETWSFRKRDVRLLHFIECADADHVENYLHHLFADKRAAVTHEVGGKIVRLREWFRLTREDVGYVMSLGWHDVNALPELPAAAPLTTVSADVPVELERRLRRYVARYNGRRLRRADGRISKTDVIERALTAYLDGVEGRPGAT